MVLNKAVNRDSSPQHTASPQRSCAVDVVRLIATLLVVSVHFFLNNGYYNYPMEGKRMFVMTLIRSLCMSCVPLFMILTGYLSSRKKLSGRYYKGVIKTACIYVLSSFACAIYKVLAQQVTYTPMEILDGLRLFTLANYSWYIEMYFGLFLLAPFINLLYHGLESRRQKQVLILTMIFLTAVPVFVNWWSGIYPVTYYLLGAYIREYGFPVKKSIAAILLPVTVTALALVCFHESYGGYFRWGSYQAYEGLPCLVISVMIFGLLINLPTQNWSVFFKKMLEKAANLCLGAYLLSYIFDSLFYPVLNSRVPDVIYRLEYMPVMVPCVFLCSLALSWVVDLVYHLLQKTVSVIWTVRRVDQTVH